MVLEQLYPISWLEQKSFYAFILGISYSILGIFSPTLFLGATLGSAYGLFAQHFFPGLNINPATFALAGMAGMIGGSAGTVLTAIAMTFELTRDYNAILPVIIVVALASWLRKLLSRESIFTLKLLRKGIVVPEGLQAAISSATRAIDIMEKNFRPHPLSHNSDPNNPASLLNNS